MNKRHLVNRAVRSALIAGVALAAGGYASTTLAADANTPANLGKVTVTGSRIKRTSLETAQEVTHISRKQIQKSGFTQVGQILHRLPSGSTPINSGRGASGAVVNNFNL